jgi:hypothetical protein
MDNTLKLTRLEVPKIDMILTRKEVVRLSHAKFIVNCYNFDDEEVIPTSLHYGVYCKSNEQIVRGSTSITVSPTATELYVTLNSTDTRIINTDNFFETRTITVSAGLPDGSFVTNDWDLIIRNTKTV